MAEQPEQSDLLGVDQRVFTRVPFAHAVRWFVAEGEEGAATTMNVGRDGIAVSLGRYLRPGRVVRLRFEKIVYQGNPVDLEGRITWCKPAGLKGRFSAGVQFDEAQPETLASASEVFYTALWKLHKDGVDKSSLAS